MLLFSEAETVGAEDDATEEEVSMVEEEEADLDAEENEIVVDEAGEEAEVEVAAVRASDDESSFSSYLSSLFG